MFHSQVSVRRDLVAVIDIGSNSVRLIITDLNSRLYNQQLLNEKVTCQLGSNLIPGSGLDPGKRQKALSILKWFAYLCQAANCNRILVFATEAIRRARDGTDFVSDINKLLGVKTTILSGEEEARTSALGVQTAIFRARGIVVDLGGGSMELADLTKTGKVKHAISLPCGTLSLHGKVTGLSDRERYRSIRTLIRKSLCKQNWVRGDRLYLVGGIWRALALLHMHENNYPLQIVHRYSLKTGPLYKYCKKIALGNNLESSYLQFISPKRQVMLPVACAILTSLLKKTGVKQVVFSGTGVREGYLYSQLKLKLPTQPEVEASTSLAAGTARFLTHKPNTNSKKPETVKPDHGQHNKETAGTIGEALFSWSQALRDYFPDTRQTSSSYKAYLRHFSACNLAEFGWNYHPSCRAEQTALIILRSNSLPFSHRERAFLSLCLFRRHGGMKIKTLHPKFKRLLGRKRRREASILGLFLRIGINISSAIPDKLKETKLERSAQGRQGGMELPHFILQLPPSWEEFPSPKITNEIEILQRKYAILIEVKSGI